MESVEAQNSYSYSSEGVKLRVVHRWNSSRASNPLTGSAAKNITLSDIDPFHLDASSTIDYTGNLVYKDGEADYLLFKGGYYDFSSQNYYYYDSDHLGSVRDIWEPSESSVQNTRYYPFGMSFVTSISGDKGLNFITTSHNEEKEGGMARLYQAQLYAYTIRELNHNHPLNIAYPSGSFIEPGTGIPVGRVGRYSPSS